MYTIPSHHALRIPIINTTTRELTIRVKLATYKYKKDFEDLGIAGSFNGYRIQSPEKMTKRDDGTYTYEIKSTEKIVEYQLCGIEIEHRTVNAPESEGYKQDRSGDYQSLITPKDGKALVVFDPAKLLKRDAEYNVEFIGESYEKKIFNYYDEYMKLQSDITAKSSEARAANVKDFHYDRGAYFQELLGRIDTEKDNECKDCLKLLYVSAAMSSPKEYNFEKAAVFFGSIPPENDLWEIMPMAYFGHYTLVPQYKAGEIEETFLKKSKSMTIISAILMNKLAMAKYKGNEEDLKKIHELIKTEYKDVQVLQDMLARFPIEIKMKVGAAIPDYEVASLSNPSEKFSKKNMLGKIYIIDFWATWCGPCVGEMEVLHHAYEKFRTKGLDILSLSRDVKAEDIIKFRGGKWKMPWKHSFIGDVSGAKLSDKFEVIGIPQPFLISAEGTILAMGEELRGENLDKTLTKYFK
jgi:thiol-disulfide isomerase/thioredoxin